MLRAIIVTFAVTAALLPAGAVAKGPLDCDSGGKAPAGAYLLHAPAPEDIAEFLRVHNQARQAVGVPGLKWSRSLCTLAFIQARTLAQSGTIKHDQDRRFGENLFWGSGRPYTGADAARYWLGENVKYAHGPVTAGNYRGTAHYTQMVWAKTTQVGFWVAKDLHGATIVVALYEPRGNKVGETPYPQRYKLGQF